MVLVALHAAAAAALLAAQLSWLIKVATLVALALSLRRAWCMHASRTAGAAVVSLIRRENGDWVAQRRDGTAFIGTLARDSVIHRHLVVVGIEDGWRTLFTPVPADALNTDDHRRLRVWVKWQPPPSGTDAAA